MKKPEFGSVKWQEMMEKRIHKKLKKNIPLDASERTFIEVQAIHNVRRFFQKKLKEAV